MKLAFSLCLALACAVVPALAIPVSVTVVGPDDKPLADAKISVLQGGLLDKNMADGRGQSGAGGVFSWDWAGQFGPLDTDIKNALKSSVLLRVKAAAPGMVSETRVLQNARTTIHLWPARDWSGVMLDQNQRPVAGVTLRLKRVQPPGVAASDGIINSYLEPTLAVDDILALTDANGRWNFLGLPARGRADLEIDETRYSTQKFSLLIGEGEAAPIVLQEGAKITGVLLKPDGAPLAGANVRAGYRANERAVTDAQGRFDISGLEAGELSLSLDVTAPLDQKAGEVPAFLFSRKTNVKVEAGQTTDLGEIKAQTGLIVKVRIVSAATKLPLDKAVFRGGVGQQVEASIDENGQLQARLLISEPNDAFNKASIESEGYVDYPLSPAAFTAAKGSLDLGTIEMKSGNAVVGTVRTEGGGDASRLPTIYLERDNKNEFLRIGKTGAFKSKTLEVGAYKVSVSGKKDWQLVSPLEVVVPAAGQTAAPLEIVVKRLTPFAPLIRELRGQLLDAQGRPVTDAKVTVRFKREDYGFFSDARATSDVQGNFAVTSRSGNAIAVEWGGTTHPNMLIGGEPKIEIRDGIATVTGLTAKKRGAIFAGHVVGADGQPAANAWVAVLEAPDYAPVQADVEGKFGLLDVPLEKFTLIAAHNRDWTQLATQSDKSGVTLPLTSAPAMPDLDAVREQIVGIKDGVSWDDLVVSWDIMGTPLVERYIRRNGEPRAEIMALFGAELARRDPAQLLKRAPEFLAATAGESRENLGAQINGVRPQSGDESERALANAWLDAQKSAKREINARSVTQLLQMAVVAQQLKRPDAAQWLDYATALSAQLGANAGGAAQSWSVPLGQLGFEATTRLVENWKAPAEFALWTNVGPRLAKSGDVAGARRALARLQTLALAPEIAGADKPGDWQIAPRRINATRQSLARALAAKDGDGAIELAAQITDADARVRTLLLVADDAMRANHADSAEKAVRAAMKNSTRDVELLALAASLGAQIRPQLGAELFASALEQTAPDAKSRFDNSTPSMGRWAFYHAPFDAALSRVLSEREWNWRLPAALTEKDDVTSRNASALIELTRAMAAIDTKRAAELQVAAVAVEVPRYVRKVSAFDVAVVALANDSARARWGLETP